MNPGFLHAACAFTIWGLLPLYLALLSHVAPLEVVLQRSLWSLVFVAVLLTYWGRWSWLKQLRAEPRRLAIFVFSAALLAANWLVYVYAVQSNQVVEASLGYFINPLVSVLLGVVVLRERLTAAKWLAVALAAAGVAWLTWYVGRLPWIALALAFSFGIYGLVRKTSSLGAVEGLALETLLLAPIVIPGLLWWTWAQGGVWARGDLSTSFLLALSGPLSALPLLFFASAARQLPLATLGLCQYLSPTLQLLLGVWFFHESFGTLRAVGFALIWAGLVLVSVDALRQNLRHLARHRAG